MIKFHPDIHKQIQLYRNNGVFLNMLFYGPPGSGKHTLVIKLLEEFFGKLGDAYEHNDEILGCKFYVSDHYIYIDGYDWKNSKVNVCKCIEEFTQTQHVNRGGHKVIYIRYIDVFYETQQELRQLVEDSYKECRFIFTTRSIDSVDASLVSRCIPICVPSPKEDVIVDWLKSEFDTIEPFRLKDIYKNSYANASIAYHMAIFNKECKKSENTNVLFANIIYKTVTTCRKITEIHDLAEKFFRCNVSLSYVLREYMKKVPDDEKKESLCVIQKFTSQRTKSIFDIIELFLGLTRASHPEYKRNAVKSNC